MATYDILGFVAHMAVVQAEMAHLRHGALEKGAVIIETEAKRVLGTYDYGWVPLAASTVERKANGDTPLLETGEMRDSIEHQVVSDKEAQIGSASDIAGYQEFGTSRIPARPFLGGAAVAKGEEVAKVTSAHILSPLIGKV